MQIITWERLQREQEAPPLRKCADVSRLCPACSNIWRIAGPRRVTPSSTLNARRSIAIREVRRRSRKRRPEILDAPADDTLAGLRDRAILAVGLQVGFRRAEIAALNVGDLHENRGFDTHRVTRKGGRRDALAINPQAAKRIRALRRWPNAAALPGTLAFPQRRERHRLT